MSERVKIGKKKKKNGGGGGAEGEQGRYKTMNTCRQIPRMGSSMNNKHSTIIKNNLGR